MELPSTILDPSSENKTKSKKKFLMFQEMKLPSSNVKNFLYFLVFQETETSPQKFLIFQEELPKPQKPKFIILLQKKL